MEGEELSTKYRPISPLGYIGYQILFSIPVIGVICILIFSFSSKKINRRNFARSYILVYVLAILLVVLLGFRGIMLTDILFNR